jgi:hypothetical protein
MQERIDTLRRLIADHRRRLSEGIVEAQRLLRSITELETELERLIKHIQG